MSRQTYRLTPRQGLSSLERSTEPQPDLQPGQVRVAVHAVSLNARDLLIASSNYPAPADRAIVPCCDGAGEVIEAAADVTDVAVGDRVVGGFFRDWHTGQPSPGNTAVSYGCDEDGWLATTTTVAARAVVRIPDSYSFADAACMPCAGVTAWAAMFEFAKLRRGGVLLVQGTGGVATWAAQLAAASGIRCIVVSTSAAKLAALEQAAGTVGILSGAGADWSGGVMELTNGRGVDLVLELLGRHSIDQSLRSACFGGHVAVIGGLSGWEYAEMPIPTLIVKRLTLGGIYVGSTDMLTALLSFCAANQVRPLIGQRFSFGDAPQAFAALAEGKHPGKLVIELA
jgi:NADPH:quinone reductase-like Zn-dependent oxidoreductase